MVLIFLTCGKITDTHLNLYTDEVVGGIFRRCEERRALGSNDDKDEKKYFYNGTTFRGKVKLRYNRYGVWNSLYAKFKQQELVKVLFWWDWQKVYTKFDYAFSAKWKPRCKPPQEAYRDWMTSVTYYFWADKWWVSLYGSTKELAKYDVKLQLTFVEVPFPPYYFQITKVLHIWYPI